MSQSEGQGVARHELERLVESYRPVLLDCARRLCRNGDEAEDLVQDAIVRALENSHKLRSLSGARTWLVTIMTRQYLDEWRRSRGRPRPTDVNGIDVPVPDPEPAPPWDGVTVEAFRAALAGLEDTYRVPFVMAAIEGRRHREIAEVLRINVVTVATRIVRARERLREKLSPGSKPGDVEDT